MVEFSDGSVKAHLGAADMRVPIQYALSYPHRWSAPLAPVDFTRIAQLTFEEPNMQSFRLLPLALEAGRAGGTCPAALNAANEIAVQAFLSRNCGFLDMERIVSSVLEKHKNQAVESCEQLKEVDAQARLFAQKLVSFA
jgi:1-deoxy-D-xylulose-5-phosphate reductoisomerase